MPVDKERHPGKERKDMRRELPLSRSQWKCLLPHLSGSDISCKSRRHFVADVINCGSRAARPMGEDLHSEEVCVICGPMYTTARSVCSDLKKKQEGLLSVVI